MNHSIACTPRTLPPKNIIKAANAAVIINPQNRPHSEGLTVLLGRTPRPEELAVATSKYWGAKGVKLTVGFLDNPNKDLRNKIMQHMNAWNKEANIEFVETSKSEDAQVRINRQRMNDPDWDGYWSFLGTDILMNEGPNGQTMNLEGFTMKTDDSEFYRVVRHEAGHTLGFPHEHMRKELVDKIDRRKAIAYYMKLTGWNEETVIDQVLTPLVSSAIVGTAVADPSSIMAYQVPGEVTKDGLPIIGGIDIGENDHEFAALIYPK